MDHVPDVRSGPLPSAPADLSGLHPWPDHDRPVVRANMIASLDGRATLEGTAGGLGTPADQQLMAVLRAAADVVLVGAGTIRAEGYEGLGTGEQAELRRQLRPGHGPVRLAVVTARGLPDSLPALDTAAAPPLVLTTSEGAAVTLCPRAEILECGTDADPGRADPAAMIEALAERGLTRILCEGGPSLLTELLAADLVDELCLTRSPLVLGSAPKALAARLDPEIQAGRPWTVRSVHWDGDHLFTRHVRRR